MPLTMRRGIQIPLDEWHCQQFIYPPLPKIIIASQRMSWQAANFTHRILSWIDYAILLKFQIICSLFYSIGTFGLRGLAIIWQPYIIYIATVGNAIHKRNLNSHHKDVEINNFWTLDKFVNILIRFRVRLYQSKLSITFFQSFELLFQNLSLSINQHNLNTVTNRNRI